MAGATLRTAVLACALGGCLRVPEAAPESVQASEIELTARDLRGESAPLSALPRRPVIELRSERGFADLEAIVLLSGRADEALVMDLAAAPLRAEHAARALPLDAALDGTRVTLSPRRTLDAGTDYVLCVLGSARDASGTLLSSARAPLVAALHTSDALDAGATVRRTFPADGATGVAINLARIVVAFDGAVTGAVEGVWLEDATGRAVAASVEHGACEEALPGFGAGDCTQLMPSQPLAALADYAIVVGDAARDAHAAPVGPFRARFRTGTGADLSPPQLLPTTCALDEETVEAGCALLDDHAVSLRAFADEPVVATLSLDAARADVVADRGEVALRLGGFEPDAALPLQLRLVDAAGNERTLALSLRTAPALVTIAISEVRADPLGPEPAQEYVELYNYGRTPVELLGLALSDDPLEPGVAIDRALRLEPAGRVLLVAASFDPRDERDGALPPGVMLLRAPGAIAGSGLSNAGEALALRDADGRRLSGAPATPMPRPGVCLVRIGGDPRDSRPEAFAYDAAGGCTPGR